MSFQDQIKQILTNFRFIPLDMLIKLTGQKCVMPFYHSITDAPPIHLKHLYQIKNTRSFASDLDFLLKHYEPVDLVQLNDIVQNRQAIKKPIFFLSFDDGLREINDVVVPVLKEKGVPATVFLNSAFVDNQDLFYRYKASILIEKLTDVSYTNGVVDEVKRIFEKDLKDKGVLVDVIKNIGYSQKDLLDQLAKVFGIDFDDYLTQNKPYLTTSQIRDLSKQGISFGAHSIDHPEYRFLSQDEQIRQSFTSLEFVKQKLNPETLSFSFPFTDYQVGKDFFDTLFNDSDLKMDLTFGCAGMKKEKIEKHLQRIPFEAEGQSAHEILNAEYLYYFLKAIVGRNTINR